MTGAKGLSLIHTPLKLPPTVTTNISMAWAPRESKAAKKGGRSASLDVKHRTYTPEARLVHPPTARVRQQSGECTVREKGHQLTCTPSQSSSQPSSAFHDQDWGPGAKSREPDRQGEARRGETITGDLAAAQPGRRGMRWDEVRLGFD